MVALAVKHGTAECRLLMPPDCTVRNISDIARNAREQFSTGKDMTLDCVNIETADFTFVQLAVSAQRSLEARSRTLTLANAPSPVLAAFARAGVPLPATASSLSGAP